jgi:hypothetical protein
MRLKEICFWLAFHDEFKGCVVENAAITSTMRIAIFAIRGLHLFKV